MIYEEPLNKQYVFCGTALTENQARAVILLMHKQFVPSYTCTCAEKQDAGTRKIFRNNNNGLEFMPRPEKRQPRDPELEAWWQDWLSRQTVEEDDDDFEWRSQARERDWEAAYERSYGRG